MHAQTAHQLTALTAATRAGQGACVAGQAAPASYFFGYWFSLWRA